MQHLQFGAGHFGLGFGAWIFSKRKLPSVVIARASRDERVAKPDKISRATRNRLLQQERRFIIQYKDVPNGNQDPKSQFEIIRYAGFVTYNDDVPSMDLLDTYFAKDTPLIITFSFGDERAYETPLRYVARAVEIREKIKTTKPIFLMAFENSIPTSTVYKRLLALLGRSILHEVIPLEVCVDRVCTEFSSVSSDVTKTPKLQILVERHFSLVIEDRKGVRLLKRLFHQMPQVVFSKDIEIEKLKKRWLLNGSHALLGICAIFYGFGQFHEYLISDKLTGHAFGQVPSRVERAKFAQSIIHELGEGFLAHVKSIPRGKKYLKRNASRISDYEAEIFQRFCSTYDSTNRIMKAYVQPKFEFDPKNNTYRIVNSMQQFFAWMRPRLDAPVKAYMQAKKAAPEHITLALLYLFELIAGGRFIDTIDLE